MYPILVLEDNTETVHSEQLENGGVKVYVETPNGNDKSIETIFYNYVPNNI